MLAREEIETLLALQAQAYRLLMWLADAASGDPAVLSPQDAAALREPDSAAGWLEHHRSRLPGELVPADPAGAFANLFSSFFNTSFGIRHLEFEGRIVESRVTLGAVDTQSGSVGLEQCQALALRHLAASMKLPITDRDARQLVRRKDLRVASLLWAYAWELDRRARRKGKGTVVHQIWRGLPKETRKALCVEHVWSAREQFLQAVREVCAAEAP